MFTIAEEIYPQDYHQLKAVISAIQNGETEQASRSLAEAQQSLSAIPSQPQRLQVELFINALQSRLHHAQVENLYLVPDEGQQIRMFNFMAERFPVVRHAQDIANQVFLSQLPPETGVTILDIGIGSGQQMSSLVQQVTHQHPQVKNMTIIGIEPSEESLCKARTRLEALSGAHGVSLSVTGILKTVEQLDDTDWALIERRIRETPGRFWVNASFALHHVPPELRTPLFCRLKALNPDRMMIIEPFADYTPADVSTRFQNAWHHYGLTFRAIDTIDADEAEKSAVKRIFFGREMVDVLGEGARVEQFETAEMWVERLREAGFLISRIRPEWLKSLPENFNPVIRLAPTDSYIGFNASGYPIVAVICAV